MTARRSSSRRYAVSTQTLSSSTTEVAACCNTCFAACSAVDSFVLVRCVFGNSSREGDDDVLTLRVLGRLARFLQTVLAPLFLSRVARQEARLLELRPQGLVH